MDRLRLDVHDRRRIEADTQRARLVQTIGRLHLTLEALDPEDDADDGARLIRREVDILAAPGIVVTVHRGSVAALDRFADAVAGETSLGLLDAGDLLSSVVDEIITGYYLLAEAMEQDIDRLDQKALRAGPEVDILADIVALRRRIALVRRVLAPHRSALAGLARPEMALDDDVGQPWPGLVERLEGALSAIEALRDALLGTYDIHMGRSAQRANDVMKLLTLLSAILLPSVVLAGIMGMNFKLPFFDESNNFFVVIGLMAAFSVVLVGIARWRRW